MNSNRKTASTDTKLLTCFCPSWRMLRSVSSMPLEILLQDTGTVSVSTRHKQQKFEVGKWLEDAPGLISILLVFGFEIAALRDHPPEDKETSKSTSKK